MSAQVEKNEDCWTWKGKEEHHQEQAAISAIEGGLRVFPWSWIELSCSTPLCMQAEHMIIRAPEYLAYPDGVCIYCGQVGWDRDHLLPATFTGVAVRKHVLTVPSCLECNSMLNDSYAPSITERRLIVQGKLQKKYRKVLFSYEYTDDELEEFGPGLRPTIARARVEREAMWERVNFPSDPNFDIRYLNQSGIEDPYALGILGRPNWRP